MLYMHDVWANWFESEPNAHKIPDFHEWRKEEKAFLIDQTVVLKVDNNYFNWIVFGLNKMDDELLNEIRDKSYYRINHERLGVEYLFICTDGERVMAVELNNYGYVKKKSHLIPRQYQLAIELVNDLDNDFEKDTEYDLSNYTVYAGLTRMERELQFHSIDFISKLLPEKTEMLKYLISEWDLMLHKLITKLSFNEIKIIFLDELKKSDVSRLVEFNKVINKLKIIN